EDVDRLVLGEVGRIGFGGGGRPVREEDRREQHGDERERGEESQRRNDQSLFPRKFSGVTTRIATACATTSPSPRGTSSESTPRFAKYAVPETVKKRSPW